MLLRNDVLVYSTNVHGTVTEGGAVAGTGASVLFFVQ